MVSDFNIPNQHRPGSNQAAIANNRSPSCGFPDGGILINPAVFPNHGKTRNKNPVQPVRERKSALYYSIRADISPMAVRAAAHKKGEDIPQQSRAHFFLQAVQPPEAVQAVSPGIINDSSSDTHPILPVFACCYRYRLRMCSSICGKSSPIPFIIFGKRLWAVNPGMVFTS